MTDVICTVLDQAADRYLEPFFAPTLEFAIRGFKQACGTEDHQFGKFPEDYALYHIGNFDATIGKIEEVIPHKLANASSFVGVHADQIDIEGTQAS